MNNMGLTVSYNKGFYTLLLWCNYYTKISPLFFKNHSLSSKQEKWF